MKRQSAGSASNASILSLLESKLSAEEIRSYQFQKNREILVSTDEWDFKKFRCNQKVIKLIQKMSQCRKQIAVKELRLSSNKRPAIIKQISPVMFGTTMMLDVASNQISSIEGIAYLYMPFLERLNLYSNQITNINSLRKTRFTRLIYLSLLSNPDIPEASSLSQMEMKNMLWLYLEHSSKNSVLDENLRWIFKINVGRETLQYIQVKSSSRIDERQFLRNQMLKAYPKMTVDFAITL